MTEESNEHVSLKQHPSTIFVLDMSIVRASLCQNRGLLSNSPGDWLWKHYYVRGCHVMKKGCSRVTVTEFENADRRTDQGTSASGVV